MQLQMPENDLDLAARLLSEAEHNIESACDAVRELHPRGKGGVGIALGKRADELCKIVRKMAGERTYAYREPWAR